MKLAQASAGNLSGRGAGLLEVMFLQSPLLQEAEFRLDSSTHFVTPDKQTFSNSAARAVNAAIQRDAQAPNPTAVALSLYSREVSLDDVYGQDARVGLSPAGLRLKFDRDLKALAAKLGEEVSVDMLAGTNASYRMLGFSTFIADAAAGGQTAALGFTAAEQAAMNHRVSLQLAGDDNQREFLEVLEKKMAEVPGANALICNTNLKARLGTIAKKFGAAGETRNTFGTPLATVNGVPIIPVTTDAIPQTETDGTDATLTSLYVVRFAEDLGVAFTTNSGFKFDDIDLDDVKPDQVARLQMFLSLAVEKTNALRRLSRIKL